MPFTPLSPRVQAKRQQRKLNFLITQTELYAHFMGGKGEMTPEEILSKLEDPPPAQRQTDAGGAVKLTVGQDDYGTNATDAKMWSSLCCVCCIKVPL